MRIVNYIFFFIFIMCAAVQYNDPDPYIWVPIYGFAAVVSLMAARGRFYPKAILGGMIILSIYAATYVPAIINWVKMGAPSVVETMKAEQPHIELTREFGGLLICLLGLSITYFQSKKL